jgi:hypothetical protein
MNFMYYSHFAKRECKNEISFEAGEFKRRTALRTNLKIISNVLATVKDEVKISD